MIISSANKVISGDFRLYVCCNLRITRWIFVKYFMDSMPFESSLKLLCFPFLVIGNTNVMGEKCVG